MEKNKILIIFLSIIFFIIICIFMIYLKEGIQLSKLNNMYKDIDLLQEYIDLYYLNNGELPIKNDIINFENSINLNDNDKYYEVDLNKLDNLKLSYGNNKNDKFDIYIVNEQSHTVYYYKGIEYNKKIYYTIKNNYINVELEKYQ